MKASVHPLPLFFHYHSYIHKSGEQKLGEAVFCTPKMLTFFISPGHIFPLF
ncbi:Uncharacterized protein dnm_078680 [Desulfonema magnum]|uniref:Uncharacterized protein n=1 Tax=Desulfonema magnum TaxID=45655 RepID=A0A975BV48_9BACT|nr:Uncharacterized protein dnm_078680 [Desulfonema magnum]